MQSLLRFMKGPLNHVRFTSALLEKIGRTRLRQSFIRMPDGCRLSAFFGTPQRILGDVKAVVLVHGFAAEKTENGLFSETARHLVAAGHIVLAYDWRGLGNSKGDFSNSRLETHVEDFKNVLRWLREEASISNSEICAVGFSLGATIVAKAVQSGERLGSAVFWSPATSPARHMWPRYNTKDLLKKLNSRGFVTKPDTRVKLGKGILESLRDTDLGERAFDLGISLLVCHGSNDTRIPISASRVCFDRVLDHNVNRVFFAEFAGASHSFRPEKRYREDLIGLLSDWLHDPTVRDGQSRKRVFLPADAKSRESADRPASRSEPESQIEAVL